MLGGTAGNKHVKSETRCALFKTLNFCYLYRKRFMGPTRQAV